MESIPVQLDQLLTLALGVVFVTQGLKAAARFLDVPLRGKGAVAVSAAVAVGMTLLAYGAGWVTLLLPTCDPAAPLACAESWLVTAGGVLALANVLYVAVYARVFGAPGG